MSHYVSIEKARIAYASTMKALGVSTMRTTYIRHGDTEHLYAHRSIYATPSELYRDKTLTHEQCYVYAPLLCVFDAVRASLGHALRITSGKRSQAAQEHLLALGKKAARTSPHVYGVALDIHVPSYMTDVQLADAFCDVAKTCTGSTTRVGYLSYRTREDASSSFIHVDMAPMIYHDALPASWEKEGLRW